MTGEQIKLYPSLHRSKNKKTPEKPPVAPDGDSADRTNIPGIYFNFKIQYNGHKTIPLAILSDIGFMFLWFFIGYFSTSLLLLGPYLWPPHSKGFQFVNSTHYEMSGPDHLSSRPGLCQIPPSPIVGSDQMALIIHRHAYMLWNSWTTRHIKHLSFCTI